MLFIAHDKTLNRRVSLRVNFYPDDKIRAWFLREAEALAQLDHPALRHVYDAGVVGELAYRVGNWIEGESLQEAVQRGPRPFPTVHTLARDILTGLRARAHPWHHRPPGSAGIAALEPGGTRYGHRPPILQLDPPVIPPGEEPSGKAVHGA